MKSKIIISALLLLGLSVAFNACKKKADTGGLIVKVKLSGSSSFIAGAEVGLSTSQANLDNSIYVQDKTTDATGKVDFGQLKPGTYYYDGYHDAGSDDYYGEGTVEIVAGKDSEQILTLD